MVFEPWRHFVWDFCLAPRPAGSDKPYELFYLRETRREAILAQRHAATGATIARATSTDLVAWRDESLVLEAGEAGAWDADVIWPGCVVERAGVSYLFYTGGARPPAGSRRRQSIDLRLGLATTTDRVPWRRHAARFLLDRLSRSADPLFFQDDPAGQPDGYVRQPQSDPWVAPAPEEDAFYLFFVAGGDLDSAAALGVVNCARSTDLVTWQALGEVTDPAIKGDLRAIQVVPLAGRFYLLFSTAGPVGRRPGAWPPGDWAGTGYLVADRLTGPYHVLDDVPLLTAPYTGARVVTAPDGQPVLLATRLTTDIGHDLGALTDPVPLLVAGDGRLRVETSRLVAVFWRPTNDVTVAPAAFIERGLAFGLVTLDQALALAEAASDEPDVLARAAIPRIEYYVAMLDGAALDAARRSAIEQAALDLALTGQVRQSEPPIANFASLTLLLPRLTGQRRVEAGAVALARALPRVIRGGGMLAAIAPALNPAELTQALTFLVGPDRGDELIETDWQDDEDADTERYGFDERMALAPYLVGREQRRALVAALREAGRMASNSETFGRSLGQRQDALNEIAPYLVDDDLRGLARAIARASGFNPPAALDWPAERAPSERRAALRAAFRAEARPARWTRWDARTIAAILAELPATERDGLVAEALDLLWHHRYGYDEAAFLSRGLRAVARFLSQDQVIEQLRRVGR